MIEKHPKSQILQRKNKDFDEFFFFEWFLMRLSDFWANFPGFLLFSPFSEAPAEGATAWRHGQKTGDFLSL